MILYDNRKLYFRKYTWEKTFNLLFRAGVLTLLPGVEWRNTI